MNAQSTDPSEINSSASSTASMLEAKPKRRQYIVPLLWILAGFIVNVVGISIFTYIHYLYFFYGGDGGLTFSISSLLFPALGYIIIAWGVIQLLLLIFPELKGAARRNTQQQEALKAIRDEVAKNPRSAIKIWDLGQETLQLYFTSNRRQMNYIFIFSVGVMLAGFILITLGITNTYSALNNLVQLAAKGNTNLPPSIFTPAIVGGISGVITEFIGATFLFMYRSIVDQANNNIKTLERITTVGMAMGILDTLSSHSEATKDLRDETAAEIAKMILSEKPKEAKEEKSGRTTRSD